uniref:DNA-directed RNA polymerase RBP11-like dimerisation domain-containing protein n=1 Tax=Mantoniella antarctica TaxID=81844 RepID=A0A7S0STD8_9CHLO|mmetsp:Transcript_23086/g.37068  ORF Transcript_23086/g.37068 Transcript_23086/m.37068 type:complete len:122 (+) Transcript_23086:295-660(+)|eukprot:CAMPEP_0181358222 /NCGR_PEP_ID=MMETSP1106-20121128/5394_1 /TAXON_ID=81844 /ORGANISM="Mantoniella antarctica, Strain SL-175" /LENGTH=121 /DNA_ID=CAMNT_0023471167 /DNA_START=296 /DNA_END=661 /DNA_ORIENTATION=-
MNQPSRAEKFVLPDGVRKLTFTRDTKVSNAGTFIVQKEDHTLGNIVRMQLHRDPNVVFAGYQVPHPSDNRIVIKVHTNKNSSPMQAITEAVNHLRTEMSDLSQKFKDEVTAYKSNQGAGGF